MRIFTITVVLAAYSSFNAPAVKAQLSAMGPVVNGHHHLNVSDVDAHLHFWVETLGGEPGTFGSGTQIVLFPDALVFLRVPDFDAVERWRLEQEHKLRAAAAGPAGMSDAEVVRVIGHFERLTRWNLEAMPARADAVVELDRDHGVAASRIAGRLA